MAGALPGRLLPGIAASKDVHEGSKVVRGQGNALLHYPVKGLQCHTHIMVLGCCLHMAGESLFQALTAAYNCLV